MTTLGGEVALGATNAVQGQAFMTVATTGTALAGKVILQKGDEIIAVLVGTRVYKPISGRMVFFEVKTTRVGTVPNISPLQSNSQAYISGIMQETARLCRQFLLTLLV